MRTGAGLDVRRIFPPAIPLVVDDFPPWGIMEKESGMFSRKIILARAAIALGAVALAGAACDERSGPADEGPEILEEDLEDRADDRDEDVDDDPLSGCRQVTPTVLGVSFDTSPCNGEDRHLTVLIDEEVPWCGEVLSWWQELTWLGTMAFEIVPHAFMCSDDWEPCEPGEATRVQIDVVFPQRGVFTVRVAGDVRTVECTWDDCFEEQAWAGEVRVVDGRPHRLFGVGEDIAFFSTLSTDRCGCSEFLPLDVTPDAENEGYYMTTPRAIVCENRCCPDCGCVDTQEEALLLPGRGSPGAVELVFEEGYEWDVRGFVADPMSDAASGCSVQPARIVAVDGPPRYDRRGGAALELQVTVAVASYPSPSCCEALSALAFDIERPGELRLFAFSGLCPDCDGAPCPPERTVTLVMPEAGIDCGIYTVSDDVTGDELFSFIVYSG